jgi:hypothetical protein
MSTLGLSRQFFEFTHHMILSVYSALIIPWEQLINPVDFVVGDPAEGIGKPSLWIDTVELCGLNQGIDDGCGFAPTLGPHEHVILRPMAMPRMDRSAVLLSNSRNP